MESEKKTDRPQEKAMFDFSDAKGVLEHQSQPPKKEEPEPKKPEPKEPEKPKDPEQFGGIKNHPWNDMKPRKKTRKEFFIGLVTSRFVLLLTLCMISVLRMALDIALWDSAIHLVYVSISIFTLVIAAGLLTQLYTAPKDFGGIEKTNFGPFMGG